MKVPYRLVESEIHNTQARGMAKSLPQEGNHID